MTTLALHLEWVMMLGGVKRIFFRLFLSIFYFYFLNLAEGEGGLQRGPATFDHCMLTRATFLPKYSYISVRADAEEMVTAKSPQISHHHHQTSNEASLRAVRYCKILIS